MLAKDDGVHGSPIVPLGLLHQSLKRILIAIRLPCKGFHPLSLSLLDEAEPLCGHLGHIVVELDQIIRIQPREVRLRDTLAVSTRIFHIAAEEDPWD